MSLVSITLTFLNLLPNLLILVVSLLSLSIYKDRINSYMLRLVVGVSVLLVSALFLALLTNSIVYFFSESIILRDLPEEFLYFVKAVEPLKIILTVLLIVWIGFVIFMFSPEHSKFLIVCACVVAYFIIWQFIGQYVVNGLSDVLSNLLKNLGLYYIYSY